MNKKPSQLKRLGLEMFSIIFAVLLALALDSWQEQAKRNEKRDHALSDIALEIVSFTTLETAIEYNEQILNTLLTEIQQYQLGGQATFTTGLGRPEVKSLAWSTSQTTGIAAEFDRDLLLEMGEIYSEYDRLIKVFDLHTEFKMKADPDMPAFTGARYSERYIRRAIFRMKELNKKAGLFLEKHKDAAFMQALSE